MATIGALGAVMIFLLLVHLIHGTFSPIVSNLQYFSRRGAPPATSPFADKRFISVRPPPSITEMKLIYL